MLRWAFGFLVLAVLAAMVGFGGLATLATGIARLLFYLFVFGFLVVLLTGLITGRRPLL